MSASGSAVTTTKSANLPFWSVPTSSSIPMQRAASPVAERLATALRSLDLDEMSPRQALEWLWEQQGRLTERASTRDEGARGVAEAPATDAARVDS